MALNPRKLAPVQWDGDWSKLPGTLTTRHMAAICGVTRETVLAQVRERRVIANPMRWIPPYKWLRESVRQQLERS